MLRPSRLPPPRCWHQSPSRRPKPAELEGLLQMLLHGNAEALVQLLNEAHQLPAAAALPEFRPTALSLLHPQPPRLAAVGPAASFFRFVDNDAAGAAPPSRAAVEV